MIIKSYAEADLFQEVIKNCYLVHKYGLPHITKSDKGIRCKGFPKSSYYSYVPCDKCEKCGARA